MRYVLHENNSGGNWWLTLSDYHALKNAGWRQNASLMSDGFDCLDTEDVPYGWRHSFTIEAPTIKDAIASFESATHRSFYVKGCPCCGCPFSIHSSYDEKPYEYESGDSAPDYDDD